MKVNMESVILIKKIFLQINFDQIPTSTLIYPTHPPTHSVTHVTCQWSYFMYVFLPYNLTSQ